METIETTLTRWEPGLGMSAFDDASNYAGDRLDGFYVYAKNRDSGTLVRSNFACILRDLEAAALEAEDDASVLTPSFGHWACGWVEQIVLKANAPEAVVRKAEEILDNLEDYPIHDERHFSDLEYEEAATYWERLSPRYKVRMAMEERKRYHWLQKEPVWRFGRMSYNDLGNDDSTIAAALCESLREI
jgi:hypothetical protein